MKKLIFILFAIFPYMLAAPKNIEVDVDLIIKRIEYDKMYSNVIESLKSFEGLRTDTYYCPAGYKTIGYGHLIKTWDRIPSTITESAADSLLRADFDKCISDVQKMMGYDRYSDSNKLLALSHFVFNIGPVKFQNSTLIGLAKENKPVKYELMKWVHYRAPDSTVMVSSNLKKMRQYEANLYHAS